MYRLIHDQLTHIFLVYQVQFELITYPFPSKDIYKGLYSDLRFLKVLLSPRVSPKIQM